MKMIMRLLLLVAALVILPAAAHAQDPTPTPPPNGPTVAASLARGQVICGVNEDVFGFGFLNPNTGDITGFYVDLCRAVATAVQGDPAALDLRLYPYGGAQRALLAGEVDLLFDHGLARTLSADAVSGLEYGPTAFIDGLSVMSRFEAGLLTWEDLDGLSICVVAGSAQDALKAALDSRDVSYELVATASIAEMYAAFEAGRCSAQVADRSLLEIRRSSSADPAAFVVWETPFTQSARGPVYHYGDEQWADIVNWTLWGLIQAEALGITGENIGTFLRAANETDAAYTARVGMQVAAMVDPVLGVGDRLGLAKDFMVNVIRRVGNYGAIYDRNLGPESSLPIVRGINALSRDGGLLSSPPWR